jgi:hypothetical protein
MAAHEELTLREVRRRYILTILRDSSWDLKKASSILEVSEKFLKRELSKMGAHALEKRRTARHP